MPKEITIDSLKKKLSRMKTADKHYSDSEIYKRITTSTYRRMSSSKKASLAFFERAGICDKNGNIRSEYK
jgi:hypothetical protein